MTENSVRNIIEALCAQLDLELVELVEKGKMPSRVIQIFIDRPEGVSLQDCTELSRHVSAVLDETRPELEGYRLEVSSPGIDRPLKTERDFERNLNRRIAVQLTPGNALKRVKGEIVGVNGEQVTIKTDGDCVNIPYRMIKTAKVQIKF